MEDLDFSNYLFQVRDDLNDPFEFVEQREMTYEELYQSVGVTYHQQLVNFVTECQTYPTAQARSLAIELAKNFSPKEGMSYLSQPRLGLRLGLGTNAVRKYTEEVLETGYWERTIDPGTQRRNYTLARNTLVVFGKWLRLDADKNHKTRWGYDTPVIMSKKNMARQVNGYQALAQERSTNKAVRDEAKATIPTAIDFAVITEFKESVKVATNSTVSDAMVPRIMKATELGFDATSVQIITDILSHTIIVEELSISEGDKLFGKMIDQLKKKPGMETNDLVEFTATLMKLRANAMAESTAVKVPDSQPDIF